MQPHGGTGLSPNVAGALSYLLGALTGVVFLVLDVERAYVRFHAAQSIVFSVAWVGAWLVMLVLGAVLSVIPFVGALAGALLSFALTVTGFGLWVVLMIRAYRGEEWEVPWIGPYARRLAREAGPSGQE